MDELVTECPDGLDFSNTASRSELSPNTRIREFLKAEPELRIPTTVDSGNSSDEQIEVARHSPPPNCSICLGRVKSKCFTNSCMHQFCFSCLLEWSKIKPECPLCKQQFKSIIHNVTSMQTYDEYKIEPRPRDEWIRIPLPPRNINLLFSARLPTSQMPRIQIENPALYQLFRRDSPDIRRFGQQYPLEEYPSRLSGAPWRTYVYLRQLYANPLLNFEGEPRDVSSNFYRANPAQVHRLLPWIHRELSGLYGAQYRKDAIERIARKIGILVQTYDMNGEDFRIRVHPMLTLHTDHFIHELVNYARSPFDLIGYDRNVTYTTVAPTRITTLTLSSSEDSDVEFVDSIATHEPVQNIDTTIVLEQGTSEIRSNSDSNRNNSIEQAGASTSGVATATQTTVTTVSGDDTDEEEIKTYLQQGPNVSAEAVIRGRQGPSPKNSEQAQTNSTENIESDNSERTIIVTTNEAIEETINQADPQEITPKVEPNTTKSPQEIIVADNDSDSDECTFVCAKKPPHLRTPEYVELNSDSDSDVVFVSNEKCPMPAVEGTSKKADGKSETKKMARGENTTKRKSDRTATNCTNHTENSTPSLLIPKPSTSQIRLSPRTIARQSLISVRPRLSLIQSRGKSIYESPSSSDESSNRESTTTASSFGTSENQTSSHEEYVCFLRSTVAKRAANNDGPSLSPRKKFRKRRGKRIYESSTSEGSDTDD